MGLCYDENEVRHFSGSLNIHKMNPHKPYQRHLENHFYLNFISQNKDATFSEKRQAEKELVICQRKLDYWERHPSFTQVEKERITQEVKKKWAR